MTRSATASRPLPQWFDDAKFGIMVIWIPAAVPAFAPLTFDPRADADFNPKSVLHELPYAEMYLNSMHIEGSSTASHHAAQYGDLPYESFGQSFRAGIEKWSPEPWADLFARAGAKYVVFTAKHQDGFLLWPSATPNPHKADWQSERDVMGELAESVRARDLRFGALYTGGTDLTFSPPPFADAASLQAAIPQHQEYADYVDAHWRELIERYELDVLWNDMGYPRAADPTALVNWYRERVPGGVTNDRFVGDYIRRREGIEGAEYTDFATLEYLSDYGRQAPIGQKWESCRGIGTSFGYNREETDEHYSGTTALIRELVDCVAHGGNFLLSVGPTVTGRIPWNQAKRLLAIGLWLQDNGEAIYGSRRWAQPAGTTPDGIDIRYTETRDAVNAIVLGTPREAGVELDVTLDDAADVRLAGSDFALPWRNTAHGVRVELHEAPEEQPAFAIRISPAEAVRPNRV